MPTITTLVMAIYEYLFLYLYRKSPPVRCVVHHDWWTFCFLKNQYVVLLPIGDSDGQVVILQLKEIDDETEEYVGVENEFVLETVLGQFTRNYTQTVKRAADNKRRYAPGWVHSTCLLRGFPKGAAPHLAHDFAEQSVVCYTLCRRCPENTVAAGEGKGI